jgi:hypothetical protein
MGHMVDRPLRLMQRRGATFFPQTALAPDFWSTVACMASPAALPHPSSATGSGIRVRRALPEDGLPGVPRAGSMSDDLLGRHDVVALPASALQAVPCVRRTPLAGAAAWDARWVHVARTPSPALASPARVSAPDMRSGTHGEAAFRVCPPPCPDAVAIPIPRTEKKIFLPPPNSPKAAPQALSRDPRRPSGPLAAKKGGCIPFRTGVQTSVSGIWDGTRAPAGRNPGEGAGARNNATA